MSKLEDVAALLRNEIPQEPEEDERRPEEEVEAEATDDETETEAAEEIKPERYGIKGLAEKLGVSIKDAYDSIEVALPNDKVYTLGQIKDLAAQGLKAGKANQANQQAATDLLVSRRELQLVADQLGGKLPQEAVDKLHKLEETRKAAEVQNFLKSVPDWSDARTRDREVAAITEAAGRYGLSKSELDVLVTDSRLMKLVRDFAVAQPEQPKPVATRRAPQPVQVKRTGNQKADMLAQIGKLLG